MPADGSGMDGTPDGRVRGGHRLQDQSGPPRTVLRTVIFQPRPQSIAIGVDGQTPRPFGPAFRSVELLPGPHTFLFSGGDCCVDEVLRVNVPPGPEPFPLAHALRFKPASLYVIANTRAEVVVQDARGRGRTHSVVSVTMPRNAAESARIEVTAQGYVPYTGAVMLRAGQLTEHAVTLERANP